MKSWLICGALCSLLSLPVVAGELGIPPQRVIYHHDNLVEPDAFTTYFCWTREQNERAFTVVDSMKTALDMILERKAILEWELKQANKGRLKDSILIGLGAFGVGVIAAVAALS